MKPETLRQILKVNPDISLDEFRILIGSLSRSEIEAKVEQLCTGGLH